MTNKMRQFIKGVGSTIDLGASAAHCETRVGQGLGLGRTDAQALSGDWRKLAGDFHAAFNMAALRFSLASSSPASASV